MGETYNPIKDQKEFTGRVRLGSVRPRPKASTALVFIKNGDVVETIREGGVVKWGILRWDGYDSMFEIDLASHQLSFQVDGLPSKDSDLNMFKAEVVCSCKVGDEAIIVKEMIVDASHTLFPMLSAVLRTASADYTVEERRQAEINVCQKLEVEGPRIGRSKGFALTDITLKLTLNKAAEEYIANLETSKNALKIGLAQHTVKKQTLSHDIEIAGVKQASELSLMKTKIEFFEQMLGIGSLDAMRLSQDPTAAEKIKREQIEGEIIGMKFKLEGFVSMAETGAIAAPELAEHAKKLLSSSLFSNSPATSKLREIAEESAVEVDGKVVEEPAAEDDVDTSSLDLEKITDPD